MQYKTMVLELLQQYPELQEQLCHNRQMLTAAECLAQQLRDSDETWKGMAGRQTAGH